MSVNLMGRLVRSIVVKRLALLCALAIAHKPAWATATGPWGIPVWAMGVAALEVAAVAMLVVGENKKKAQEEEAKAQQELAEINLRDANEQAEKAGAAAAALQAAQDAYAECMKEAEESKNKLGLASTAVASLAGVITATQCNKFWDSAPCIASVAAALAIAVAGIATATGEAEEVHKQCEELNAAAAEEEKTVEDIIKNAESKLDSTNATPAPTHNVDFDSPPIGTNIGGQCVGSDCPIPGALGVGIAGKTGRDTTIGDTGEAGKLGGASGAGGGSNSGSAFPNEKQAGVATLGGDSGGDEVGWSESKAGAAASGASGPTAGARTDQVLPTVGRVLPKTGLDMTDGTGANLNLWQRATYRYKGPAGSRYSALAKVEQVRRQSVSLTQAPIGVRKPAALGSNSNAKSTQPVVLERK